MQMSFIGLRMLNKLQWFQRYVNNVSKCDYKMLTFHSLWLCSMRVES